MINEIAKFPSCVREFMHELSSYIKSDASFDKYLSTADPVSIKDGTARINLKTEVVKNVHNYHRFIKDFEVAKGKYHLVCYADTVLHVSNIVLSEIPEELRRLPDGPALPNYVIHGVHIEVFLKELVLDKLGYFFNPDSELSIPDSIQILRNSGLSDLVIMRSLNIPRTTYNRYCKNLDSKMDMEKTNLDTSKTVLDTANNEQKTELAALPSQEV